MAWVRRVLCIGIILAMVSVSAPMVSAKGTPVRQWLFMMYADGDTGDTVEDLIMADMEEIRLATIAKNVKILVLADRWHNWTDAQNSNARAFSYYAHTQTLEKDWGELNMGDPKSLSDFVVWAMKAYPSARYSLVFNDHGTGWIGTCRDYSSGYDRLTMSDLGTAFQTIKSTTGKKINLVGFDACLMQQIEVAWQIKDYANVMVGSEEVGFYYTTNFWGGWPYTPIVTHLCDNPYMLEGELGVTIVNDYREAWLAKSDRVQVHTIQAMKLSYASNIASSVDTVGRYLASIYPTFELQLYAMRLSTEQFSQNSADVIDIYHYLQLLKAEKEAGNIPCSTQANRALNYAMSYITDATIASWFDTLHPNAHGLGIYYPSRSQFRYDYTYGNIPFSLYGAPGWVTFMETVASN